MITKPLLENVWCDGCGWPFTIEPKGFIPWHLDRDGKLCKQGRQQPDGTEEASEARRSEEG